MDSQSTTQSIAAEMTTATGVTPVLIALAALVVVSVILWGTLRRRRKAAELRRVRPSLAATAPSPPPVEREIATPIAPPSAPAPAPAPAPVAMPPAPPAEGVAERPVGQIKGLGPKVAARLADLGFTTVGQLAALDDAEAATLDAQLPGFEGRMARDRWIEQARLLASGDVAGFEARFGKLGE